MLLVPAAPVFEPKPGVDTPSLFVPVPVGVPPNKLVEVVGGLPNILGVGDCC